MLFHKKEVTEGARGAVGDDLSKTILSPNHRVVGVVINAIDDRLAGAQQIRDDWTINRISPLGSLLKLARDSGRVVILASDHGHVWHRPDARNVPLETGGRWRPKSDEAGRGRDRDHGQAGQGRSGRDSIIVPWSERVYYGRQQNGYHGGASPQEMVCPARAPEGQEQRLLRALRLRASQAGMVVVGPGQVRHQGRGAAVCPIGLSPKTAARPSSTTSGTSPRSPKPPKAKVVPSGSTGSSSPRCTRIRRN